MTPCSRISRITARRPPPRPSAVAAPWFCWPGASSGTSLGQDRRFVARTHQRAEHAVHWQQHPMTVDFRQVARARGGHQAGVGGPPTCSQGGLTREHDWERSNGCLGGTHGSWSPTPPLSPFIEAQKAEITRLTKGGVGLGHGGSMTCRIRMAGRNRVLTGMLIPLYPGPGLMSAGCDRGARRSVGRRVLGFEDFNKK